MDVSVIIVNYNTKLMTSECINSVINNTKDLAIEIIVIDNGSTDGSKDFFEHDNRIRYVYSYENMGFGRANNVGMMLATGDYFFLLNSDTILLNDAINIFHTFAVANEEAFYGAWLFDIDGNHINSGGEIQTIRSILRELCKSYIPGRHEGDRTVRYSSEKCTPIGYVTGADMFFRRSVYEKTKGFDHRFFMYSEESDWQRQAAKEGIKSFLINGPKIVHLEGGSQKKNSDGINIPKLSRFTKSRYYYIKKAYSWPEYALFRILYVTLYIPKLLFGKSANINTSLKAIGVLLRGY